MLQCTELKRPPIAWKFQPIRHNPYQEKLLSKMTQNFLPNPDKEANALVPGKTPDAAPPGREAIKYLLIGSPKGVRSTIHLLHVLGFAEATAWSPLQSTSNPGEVISVLRRYILLR